MTLTAEQTAALITMAQSMVESQTTKPTFVDKLKSRKFWMSAAGCIAGILGMLGANDNVIATAIFATLSIASIVVYCVFVEGKIDSSRSAQLVESLTTLLEILGNKRDAQEEADKAMQENQDESTDIGGNPVNDDGTFRI